MKDFKEFEEYLSERKDEIPSWQDVVTNLNLRDPVTPKYAARVAFDLAMVAFEKELELYHDWLTSQLPSLGDGSGSPGASDY